MERIQAAISKARATREGQAAAETPVRREGQLATPPTREAWDVLPQITPSRSHLARNRIVATDGGREATAFDVIRTRTLQQLRDNGWKRIAVTSPSASCGKSTVCLNLALSLTRQPEVSVVLVEMDMRRPSLARTLGIRERHSVASVLSGESDPGDNAVRFGENLAILSMHGQVRNASDILHGGSVRDALARIETLFAPTVMLFDMPPLLVNDDSLAFLHNVDAALLVAAAGSTTVNEIDTCERELASHTSVMGVVLNKCRYTGRDYGADYY
ncbi:MAG: tyrosine-protein kinase family protein [Pseudooceanicola nanhaiensis]